jgi:hypothetical protein
LTKLYQKIKIIKIGMLHNLKNIIIHNINNKVIKLGMLQNK